MTAQEPEILIYNGLEMQMISNPNIVPGCEQPCYFMELQAANNRGYVGTWEIKNDQKLYLLNVSRGKTTSYPDPVFANWITEDLYTWNGNLLKYVNSGYDSMYEENIHHTI